MSVKTPKQYSPETKLQAVLESYASGNISQTAERYEIHISVLNRWRATMLEKGIEIFKSQKGRNQHSKGKVEKLEQIIGRQTIQIELLKKIPQLMS